MSITNGATAHQQCVSGVAFRATTQKQLQWALQMERQLISNAFGMLHSVLLIISSEDGHYK